MPSRGGIIWAAGTLAEHTIYSEDFNNLTGGFLAGQDGWIDATLRGSEGVSVSSELPYEGAKGIVSPTELSFHAEYRAYREITPVQRGRATVYMRVSSGAWETFWLCEGKVPENGRPVGSGNAAIIVSLEGQNNVLRFGTDLTVPATSDTWYKITVEWDAPATMAKAWVNDNYVGDFTTNRPIQNYVDGIMLDVPNHVGGLKVYFDAITITSVEEVPTGAVYYTGGLYYGPDATRRGIPSWDIMDETIRAEDIGMGAVGSEEIAAGAVGTDEIADRAVKLDKLYWEEFRANIETDKYVSYRQDSFLPTFFGRITSDSDPKNWWLQDFATSISGDYYYIWNVKWELIGQKTWRDIKVVGISNSGYGFFLAYNLENGEIGLVVEGDISMDDSLAPENYAFYDIQNHSQREEIFANPDEFVFDLRESIVRRKTGLV